MKDTKKPPSRPEPTKDRALIQPSDLRPEDLARAFQAARSPAERTGDLRLASPPKAAPWTEVLASADGPVELRIVDSPASWRFSLEPARGRPAKCLELEFGGGSVLLDAGDCQLLAEKLNALGQVLLDMQKAQR